MAQKWHNFTEKILRLRAGGLLFLFVFCFGEDTGNDFFGGCCGRFKVGVQIAFGGFDLRVAEHILDGVQIRAGLDKHGSCGVPLRYNYDKPEKPRRIKGFEVFSLVFSSFSKSKNHTETSRIIGGVSLTTNE